MCFSVRDPSIRCCTGSAAGPCCWWPLSRPDFCPRWQLPLPFAFAKALVMPALLFVHEDVRRWPRRWNWLKAHCSQPEWFRDDVRHNCRCPVSVGYAGRTVSPTWQRGLIAGHDRRPSTQKVADVKFDAGSVQSVDALTLRCGRQSEGGSARRGFRVNYRQTGWLYSQSN